MEEESKRYCIYCKEEILEGEPFRTETRKDPEGTFEVYYHDHCDKLNNPIEDSCFGLSFFDEDKEQ